MKKYISIIALFFAIGISGCKKNYLDLETNPNSPSVTTPQLSLSGAEAVAASIINTDYSNDGVWMGYWTPSGNYVPNSALQQFLITNTSFTGSFNDLYQNLTNLNNLQVLAAKDASLANYQAIAMILKVEDFQQLVDQYGDVPYSQAFQPSTILFPAYDKAQDIYNDLPKQLDAAIALINKSTGASSPGSADIIFGGTMSSWKKYANSLKLRLAVRQSNLSTNAAATDLASTASEGYLDGSVEAAANPGYSNTAGKESPFYLVYGIDVNGNPQFGNVYYRANNFMIGVLNSYNDPRINQIFALTAPANSPSGTASTIVNGNTFGDTKTTLSNSYTSAIGPGLLQSPSQNAVMFSGAESLFLQAEAAVHGYTTGANAQALYESAIKASFEALGLTDDQASTYYSQAVKNVGWNSSTDKVQAIVYQKWISMVGYHNLEAYLEYERTGYPVLPNPVSIDPASLSAVLPVRQYYPQSEYDTNAANVAKEGTINIFTSKIFWEK